MRFGTNILFQLYFRKKADCAEFVLSLRQIRFLFDFLMVNEIDTDAIASNVVNYIQQLARHFSEYFGDEHI